MNRRFANRAYPFCELFANLRVEPGRRGPSRSVAACRPQTLIRKPFRLDSSQHVATSNAIGAPGFEPGTSPTRTVRATRLRHAPTRTPVFHTANLAPVAVPVQEILAEIDGLLDPGGFADYCVNGLQVPGGEAVETIATGVSANAELFCQAAAAEAGLLLVHHGLFWGPGVRALDGLLKWRLKLLFDAEIALAAYHLPLDAHPEIGNNAVLARELGGEDLSAFARHGARTIGFLARLPGEGLPAAQLCERVRLATGHEPLHLEGGPAVVSTVAVVTGAGADYLGEAAAAGAQALVTGEPAERATALALEHGLHLIAAGHHATETFGVRRLGEHLSARFGLRHVFLDVPNPV